MKKGLLKLKSYVVPVLLAISSEEQERGLMGVKWPPPAMAFVYNYPQFNSFWMKNTNSPLDIVFCLNNKITKICKGEPFSTELISGGFSNLVIELPYGSCQKINLSENDEVELFPIPSDSVF